MRVVVKMTLVSEARSNHVSRETGFALRLDLRMACPLHGALAVGGDDAEHGAGNAAVPNGRGGRREGLVDQGLSGT